MRQRGGDGIRAVIRLGHFSQAQQHTHHFLHLFFICLAIAGNGLLDLHRGIFVNSHTGLHAAQQHDTACLGDRHSRGNIFGKKELFDRHQRRVSSGNDISQLFIDSQQADRIILFDGRADNTSINQLRFAPLDINDTEA